MNYIYVSFKLNFLDSMNSYILSFTPIGNYLLWFVQGWIEGGGATNQVSILFPLCNAYLSIWYWRVREDLLCSSFTLEMYWFLSLFLPERILLASFFLSMILCSCFSPLFHSHLHVYVSYMFHIPRDSEISCIWDSLANSVIAF